MNIESDFYHNIILAIPHDIILKNSYSRRNGRRKKMKESKETSTVNDFVESFQEFDSDFGPFMAPYNTWKLSFVQIRSMTNGSYKAKMNEAISWYDASKPISDEEFLQNAILMHYLKSGSSVQKFFQNLQKMITNNNQWSYNPKKPWYTRWVAMYYFVRRDYA